MKSVLAACAIIAAGAFYGSHQAADAVKPMPSVPLAVQLVDVQNHTQAAPVEDVWYPLGGSLLVPAGTWRLSYAETVYAARQKADQGTVEAFVSLSTSTAGPSDPRFTRVLRAGGNLYRLMATFQAENIVTVKTPTMFTLIVKESSPGNLPWDSLEAQAHTGSADLPTIIRAERLS